MFILTHLRQLCNHTDLLSNIFLTNQPDAFKVCHPELLPCFCKNQANCDKNESSIRQRVLDLLLEVVLLEKVVKASRREVERGQYLYSHSGWIGRLLERMIDERC